MASICAFLPAKSKRVSELKDPLLNGLGPIDEFAFHAGIISRWERGWGKTSCPWSRPAGGLTRLSEAPTRSVGRRKWDCPLRRAGAGYNAAMSRVVLAMSGGVDSSVAAWLLREAGHEVIGLFMRHGQEAGAAPERDLFGKRNHRHGVPLGERGLRPPGLLQRRRRRRRPPRRRAVGYPLLRHRLPAGIRPHHRLLRRNSTRPAARPTPASSAIPGSSSASSLSMPTAWGPSGWPRGITPG